LATDVLVPAREGRAVRVGAGELVRIVDTEGQQACDFWAFADGQPREFLSTTNTRWPQGDFLPHEGTVFVSNLRRPLLTFVEDGADGMHDMHLPMCSRERYRELTGTDGHPSCRENCTLAVREFFELPYELVPDAVNFFTEFPLGSDLRFELRPSGTPPGAYVTLRAETDLVVAVSACPFDLDGRLNAGRPSDVRVQVGPG
jgi:uncharacterized protein YcgI (DUF1989 family)